MRRARLLGAVLLLLVSTSASGQFDAERQKEYRIAADTILCDCGCHPQSIHDCACGRAEQMRRDVAQLIQEGRTGEEVIALYVERQGEVIRIAPVARGFNLIAWLGPLIGLIAASLLLGWMIRRWTRKAPAAAAATAPPPPADPDDPYRARLRSQLEELR